MPALTLIAFAFAATGAVTVHPIANQNVYAQKGIEVRMLVEDGDNAYLGALHFAAGATVPAHRHPHSEELLTVTRGEGEMTIDGKPVKLKAGDAVHIPMNALHDFRATGREPVDLIQVYAPKGAEDRFRSWPKK